ncbi:MAG: DUF3014 domain-containing protein [Gammaproteobacteria bacterium]|nr:DUF3014 domain-containing protein [Gammaproteobacteria bacterium]
MNKFFLGLAAGLIIVAVFLTFKIREPEITQPVTFDIPPSPPQDTRVESEPEPEIRFPVPEVISETETPRPLPALDESDESVEQEFQELVTDTQLSELLLFKTFIRNFVVISDNLSGRLLPQKYYFFQPPGGKFLVVESEDDKIFMDPDNYTRYEAFVKLVNSLDIQRLSDIYVFLYPLFQEAYEELGYPDRYFNDRLIEVIDMLLDTPRVADPVELVQPKVYYQFARPELEALSAGQKLLIRIGPENAEVIRSRLTLVREKLTAITGNNR